MAGLGGYFLSHLKRIIDFDAQVSYCTFQLGYPKKQLNRTKLYGLSIDESRFAQSI
jgi:hypothetical protein